MSEYSDLMKHLSSDTQKKIFLEKLPYLARPKAEQKPSAVTNEKTESERNKPMGKMSNEQRARIAALVPTKKSDADIAAMVGVSDWSVKYYRKAYLLLQAKNKDGLGELAYTYGMTENIEWLANFIGEPLSKDTLELIKRRNNDRLDDEKRQEAERKAKEEAERKAKEEAEKKAEEAKLQGNEVTAFVKLSKQVDDLKASIELITELMTKQNDLLDKIGKEECGLVSLADADKLKNDICRAITETLTNTLTDLVNKQIEAYNINFDLLSNTVRTQTDGIKAALKKGRF